MLTLNFSKYQELSLFRLNFFLISFNDTRLCYPEICYRYATNSSRRLGPSDVDKKVPGPIDPGLVLTAIIISILSSRQNETNINKSNKFSFLEEKNSSVSVV